MAPLSCPASKVPARNIPDVLSETAWQENLLRTDAQPAPPSSSLSSYWNPSPWLAPLRRENTASIPTHPRRVATNQRARTMLSRSIAVSGDNYRRDRRAFSLLDSHQSCLCSLSAAHPTAHAAHLAKSPDCWVRIVAHPL